MPTVDINWLAILVATVAAMVIGSVWYSNSVFGKYWRSLVGLSDKDMQEADKVTPMVAMVGLAFLQAFVLTHFVAFAQYFYPTSSDLSVGLTVGFWAWLGIALPTIGGAYLFAQRPKQLLALDAGNLLITLLVVSSILAVWG